MIEVYGKHGCQWCEQAVALLDMNNIEYKKYTLLEDMTVEEFRDKFPGVSTVPAICVDGVHIGGYQSLVEHLGKR